MRMATRAVLLLLALTPIRSATLLGSRSSSAQQPIESTEQADRDAAERINAVTQRMNFREDDPVDQARYYAELDELTNRLRGEVDDYIHTALNANEGSGLIQARLRTLLAEHRPNPEYGDPPLARVADLSVGRSLLVAYTIVRPPHHDSATVRGYRASLDRFELVATTGDADFDGFNMFKAELPSPFKDELWLLTWGQAHTANGATVRFRVYAFDGQSFRTVWTPDDMFSATPRMTSSGFTIDHEVRNPPYEFHDEYVLTPDGPVKTN
jgi:hypothetical protein